MVGTEVSTIVRGSQPIMAMNTKSIDWDKLAGVAASIKGGERMPGELILFKKGKFLLKRQGAEKEVRLKDGVEFVANMPNIMFAWRKWADGIPHQPHICYPLANQTLPAREELGDNDKSKWEIATDDDDEVIIDKRTGEPARRDPWRVVMIIMLRDGEDLYRFETDSFSGKSSVADLVKEYAEKGRRQGNKLPVISLSSEERKRKGKKSTYDAPVFAITGWEEATPEDFPEGGVMLTAAKEEEADEGETRAVSRKTAAPAKKARDVEEDEDELPKSKAKSRKAVEEDEEEAPKSKRRAVAEDDEDEAPRKRKAVAEDDEDELPKTKAKPRAAVEDDEDEPRPARRRLVLNRA